MDKKLNPKAFALAAAIIAAFIMLLLGILGNLGIYTDAVQQMKKWHIFFSLDVMGIITGIIEAAVISFVFCYLFAWSYNKLSSTH